MEKGIPEFQHSSETSDCIWTPACTPTPPPTDPQNSTQGEADMRGQTESWVWLSSVPQHCQTAAVSDYLVTFTVIQANQKGGGATVQYANQCYLDVYY